MATWTTLRSALATKLGTVSALSVVYDHFTSNFSGFPACMFEPSADPEAFATNRDNEHVYAFDIYLIQEMKKQGRSASIGTLAAAVDAVQAALDADFMLGGACEYAEAAANDWGEVELPDGPIKYARILYKCHSIVAAF
jgi:hypothetical protein